jgi:hypothetical protein
VVRHGRNSNSVRARRVQNVSINLFLRPKAKPYNSILHICMTQADKLNTVQLYVTYALGHLSLPLLLTLSRSLVFALLVAAGVAPEIMYHGLISADSSHPRDVGNVVVIEAVMTENEMVRVHVGVGNRSFCDGEGRHRASETMTADGTSAKRSTACGDRRFPCQATRERRRSHSSAPARVIPASAAACGRLD